VKHIFRFYACFNYSGRSSGVSYGFFSNLFFDRQHYRMSAWSWGRGYSSSSSNFFDFRKTFASRI